MWTFSQVLLQLLTAFLACNSVSGQNGGRRIGQFEQTQVSFVQGTAYAANENTIIIEGFTFLPATFDDAFFYIGQEIGQRPPIPYEEGGLAPLRNFINERVVIRLPGQSINDFQILYISTDNSQNSVGNLIIPEGLVLPTERRIGILGLMPIERGVFARDVVVINDRQLRLESFSYDGEAPATYFWVSENTTSNFRRRVADENGIIDQPLSGYDERTIVLTLPDDLTVFDIDYLSIWSETLMVSFGHIMIPPDLDPQSVPVALFTSKVFENCEVLESDKFQVSWHRDISRDVVCFQLRGRVDPQEYMAFGISGLTTSTLMPVSDVTVGWIDGLTGQPMVVDYYVQEYTSCTPSPGACPDVILGGQDDVRLVASHIIDGVTYITYEKPLTGDPTGHDQDIPFDRPVFISWAYGPIGINGLVATQVARNPQNLQLNFGRPSSGCPDFQRVVSQPCDSGPCLNGGSCSHTGASTFSCDCSGTGFTGLQCQTAIFVPCDLNPCRNGASCMNIGARNFRCDCQVGFTGPVCDEAAPPCDAFPCQNGGECINDGSVTAGFRCICTPDFEGPMCEFAACNPDPCQNGGTCVVVGNGVTFCFCASPFTGPMCQFLESGPCDSLSPCLNDGICNNLPGNSFTCDCSATLFTGRVCEVSVVQPCDSDPCFNGGTCINDDVTGGYTCDCTADFFGANCGEVMLPCDSSPCMNGGDCRSNIDDLNAFICSCPSNFRGTTCEEPACPFDPCMNGATCLVLLTGQTFCLCPDGFFGQFCQFADELCGTVPCLNGGICMTSPAVARGYTCDCSNTDFVGDNCERINLCVNSPCENGGICIQQGFVLSCDCTGTGFTGPVCRQPVTTFVCSTNPCLNGGQCFTTNGQLRCDCAGTGFTGPLCSEPDDLCLSDNPCLNGGRCIQDGAAVTCDCSATDFSGMLCDQPNVISVCDTVPCLNGGTCLEFPVFGDGFLCDCAGTGFTGPTCQLAVCFSGFCSNGGSCIELGSSLSCDCSGTGFTGPTCEQTDNQIQPLSIECSPDVCRVGQPLGAFVQVTWDVPVVTGGTPPYVRLRGPSGDSSFLQVGQSSTITYQYLDRDNSVVECSFTISAQTACQSMIQILNCPSDIEATVSGAQDTALVEWDELVVAGNAVRQVGGPVTNSGRYGVGRTTVSYVYQDGAGQTATCSFAVTVVVAIAPPVIENCPSDITETVNSPLDVASVDWPDLVVTGDNIFRVAGPPISQGNYRVGTIPIQYIFQDGQGRTVSCSFTITVSVEAIPPPVIENCPSDITETVNSPLDVAFVDWPDLVVTGDNIFRIIGPPISQGNYPVGTIPIQYIFQDGQGRTVSCSFTITVSVEAIPPPVIENCPSDITETVNSPQDVAFVDWPDLVVTGDNVFQITGPPISQGNYPVGTIPIQYVFQDGQGRTESCSFTISVSIGDPSSLFTGCPGDITETVLQGTGGSIVTWTPPTPRDETVLLLTSPPRPPGSFFRVGSETMRYLYFASGNFQQCLFLVTVQEDNPCDAFSCLNGGTCIPVTPTEFTCACSGCFRGDRCENDLDPCSNSQCQNGGTCQPYIGSCDQYFCQCPSCFTGIRCQLRAEPCALVQCGNGGLCTPASVGCTEYSCQCQGCFTGAQCQEVLDPCSINPCQNGGLCRPISGDCAAYSCDCQGCFSGYNCEVAFDPCLINPCLNGGSCVNDPESCTAYRCECSLCYTGFRCELEIGNPCNAFPCNNGGTCELGDSCFTFTCFCPSGFGGLTCLDAAQTVTDPCASVPCSNGGSCLTLDEASYYCICRNGYRGINCESAIDGLVVMSSCFTGVCQNGGTCFNSFTSSRPVGTLFQYACLCAPGFTGLGCLTQTTLSPASDECSTLPVNYCGANGVCQNLYISTLARVIPFCNCNPGFTGQFCNIPVEDPCATSPCRNGGQCTTFGLYFVCLCQRPYGGETCELLEGDITPPTILNCPSVPVVVRTSEGQAVVDWPELVFEDDSSFPVRIVSSNTARGAVYPVGTSFNAFFGVQDVFGNQAVCSFLVQVLQQ